MRTLRRYRAPIGGLLILVMAVWQIASPLNAATLVWDVTSANGQVDNGGGTWSAGGAGWTATGGASNTTFTNGDHVIFGGVGTLGTAGSILLGTDVTAASLTFGTVPNPAHPFQYYTIAGGGNDLTISGSGYSATSAAPVGFLANESAAVTSDVVLGSSQNWLAALFESLSVDGVISDGGNVFGIAKDGKGLVSLGNAANTYTGQTSVLNGTLVLTGANSAGAATSTVQVFGNRTTGGGTLMLATGNLQGYTFTRNIVASGPGVATANSITTALNALGLGSVTSVGNNTLTGSLTLTGAFEQRVSSGAGMFTIAGPVTLQAGQENIFYGAGNFNVTGQIQNTSAGIIKTGGSAIASTLILSNNTNAYSGRLRIDSGTVRVSDGGALGTSTAANAIEFNGGGTLEVRADAGTIGTFANKNLSTASNNGTVFVDRAIGGTGLNQVVDFGAFTFGAVAPRTLTLNGRNGYGFSIGTAGVNMAGNGGGNATFTSSSINGKVTIDGDITVGDGTAGKFAVFSTAGDMTFNGSVLSTGAGGSNNFAKQNTGTLFWNSTVASTITGTIRIDQGTLSVSNLANSFGSTVQLQFGSSATSTTVGTLTYTGAGETLSKNINVSGTTGSAVLNASGTGALIVIGTVTAGAAGTKSFFLGGTSTANNEFRGALPAANLANLTKLDGGSWTLSTGAHLNTGPTTIAGGTLRVLANSASGNSTNLADTSNLVFGQDQIGSVLLKGNGWAGGTFVYESGASGTSETLGSLVPSAGAGTIRIVNNSAGTAKLLFSGLGTVAGGSSLNFEAAGTGVNGVNTYLNVTGLAAGFINSHIYYQGTHFAFNDTTQGATNFFWRAPVYGADAGFTTSAAALTAGSHNEITGNVSSGALSINSLRINGAQTLDLTGSLTITNGGIIQTGGAGVIAQSGGGSLTTGGTGDLVVRVAGVSDTLNLAVPILATTTGGLTKNGLGVLVLEGTNLQTGATTINEGTIRLSGTGTLSGANQALVIRQDGVLHLNGVSSGTSVGSFNGAGRVTNTSASNAILTIGNGVTTNGSGGTFSGIIEDGAGGGRLGLTVTTALNTAGQTTTFSLSGVNTYTGPTTIAKTTAGNLVLAVNSLANIGQNSAIGRGDNTSAATNAASLVFNNGILQYTGSSANIFQETQTPSISIDRLFTLAGNGTIQSSGTFGNNILGAGGNNHATLIFNNSANAVAFAGAAGARLLTLGGTSIGDNEMGIQLLDQPGPTAYTLGITKADAGLWILSNTANNYSGATTISGGQLRVTLGAAGVATLSANSNLVFSGGVLETFGTFAQSIGTGAGTFQWGTNGSGGFAASYSKLTVNIGGAGAPVTWGTGGIGNGTGNLILNSTTALAEVEFTNAINLGTAGFNTRLITVNDNSSTNTDYAIISGDISNSVAANANQTALAKDGTGILILTGNNTFQGTGTGGAFNLRNGTLMFSSFANNLGSMADPTGTGRMQIGSGGNSAGLLYIGAGETVTRRIELIGTGGTARIENGGSGAIVITDVINSSTGTKTLNIRGLNPEANEISANLANGAGTLAVTKDDGGFWVLSGNNTYTGGTLVNGGVLGLGSNTAIGTGNLDVRNAVVQAIGGDRVFNNNFVTNNATPIFTGLHSMQFVNGSNVGGNSNFDNYLAKGETLTFTGTFTLAEADQARTVNFRGTGTTILNGSILAGSGTGVDGFTVAMGASTHEGPGMLQINGSAANTATGTVTLSSGILQIGKSGTLTPLGTGNFTMGNGFLQAITDLSGANALTNTFTISNSTGIFQGNQSITFTGVANNTGGNSVIRNNIASGATLTFAGATFTLAEADQTRTLNFEGSGDTVITGNIVSGTGTGVDGLTKAGSGSLTTNGVNTITGNVAVNNGTWNALFNTATTNQLGAGTLTLGGGRLLATKSDAIASSQTWTSATLTGNTASTLSFVTSGGAALNVTTGTITRGAQSTLAFVLPSLGSINVGASPLAIGGGATSWATVGTGSSKTFAIKDGANLVAAATTVTKTNVGTWLLSDNASDDAAGPTGFTGTFTAGGVNTIRFNAPTTSTVTIAQNATLNLSGGGILVTTNVGANAASITGGIITVAPHQLSGNTTNTSTTVRVGNTDGLFVGQVVSGAGIAAGTTIANILDDTTIVLSAAATSTNTATSLSFGSTTSELVIHQDNTAADFTIASAIRNPNRSVSAGIGTAVTKSGLGTVVLSGNNDFFGNLVITEGMVKLGSSTALKGYNSGSGFSVPAVVLANRANAMLDLNGFDASIGNLSGGGLLGDLTQIGGTVNVGTGTLKINQTGNTTYSGALTGTGSIILYGTGSGANTLTLNTSANSYSGTLTISNGQMVLANGTVPNGGTVANLANVPTITIMNGGGLHLNNNASLPVSRLSDTVAILLKNTAPNAAVATVGLSTETDQVFTTNPRIESVGAVTLGAGVNTLRAATGTAGANPILSMASLTRNNASTLVVLANNMDNPIATQRGDVVVRDASNIVANLVGGGSTVNGTSNISILPWAIGQAITGTGAGPQGNTFVTYSTFGGFGYGFRALTTNEYEQLGAAGGVTLTNNARYSASGVNLAFTGTGHQVNSLLVENTSTTTAMTISGSGAGDSLNVNSGAFLFLGAATAPHQAVTINGFNNGISIGTNEYVFHQLNMSGAGVTIANNLTKAGAGVTKSGNGLLVLSGNNTAVTGAIVLNKGLLKINDLDNIGGNTGTILFQGGGLRLAPGFSDDLSGRTIILGDGGVAAVANGTGMLPETYLSGNVIDTFGTSVVINLTNGTATYTLPSVAGLAIGQVVSGPGIAGTVTISNIVGNDVTFSAAPSATTANATVNFGAPVNVTINSALTGPGGLTKVGPGNLVLGGTTANTNGGAIAVTGGELHLNKTVGVDAIGAGGLIIQASSTASVARLLASHQINDAAVVMVMGNNGANSRFDLNNFSETIGGLVMTTNTASGAVVATGANGILTVNGDILLNNNRDAGGDEAQHIVITGSGNTGTRTLDGTLDLGGVVRNIYVTSQASTANQGAINSAGFGGNKPDAIIETVIQNGGINKLGSRVLFLRNANTYDGLTIISEGAIRATHSQALGSTVGGTEIKSGASLQLEGSIAISENITVQGQGAGGYGAIDSIAGYNSLNGTLNMLGDTAFGAEGAAVLVINSLVTGTAQINKVGTGTVFLNNAANNWTGGFTVTSGSLGVGNNTAPLNGNAITILNGGGFAVGWDGTSMLSGGTQESLLFDFSANPISFVGATGSLTVDRLGTTFAPYNLLPTNKTLQINAISFTNPAFALTVNNNGGYGLELTQNFALVTSGGSPTFGVTNATASNVVQGLTMSGVISGGQTGAGTTVFTKVGNGTLVLSNNGNTFGGGSSVIAINQGVLAVATNEALGNISNIIRLAPATGTATFRATSTFSTARTIQFGNTANTRAIEVTKDNVLTLTSAFDVTTFSAQAAALVKNDLGTLVINADNAAWTGALTVNQGAVRAEHSNAFGTSAGGVSIGTIVGQVQLTGGVTIADALNIAGANNQTWSGINSTGALRSMAGTNTWSGLINLTAATSADNQMRAAMISVDAGSILNITGGLRADLATSGTGRDSWFVLAGAGTGNITGTITHTNGAANNAFQLAKIGTGTWNLQAANSFSGHQLFVLQGTLALNGAATLGTPGIGNTATSNNTIFMLPKGTLLLDSTGTNTNNRLSNRNLDFRGGELTILGNSAATTTETTTGTVTLNPGATILTVTAGAGQQANFTTGAVTRNAGSTVLFRGTNLGNAPGADVATIQATGAGYTFVGQAGAAGSTSKAILPWGIVDTSSGGSGISFATADTATGRIRALAASEYVSTLTGATANFENVRLTTLLNATNTAVTQLHSTINSLQLNSGGGLALGDMRQLTLDSGGILALAGNTGISGGLLSTTSNREMIVYTVGDLNIASAITLTSGGLTKSGEGMLTLSSTGNSFTGNINMLQGTLKLSGGDNTIFFNNTLQLQNGTVDLNGTLQHFASLVQSTTAPRNGNLLPNSGGIVTNSQVATQATLAIRTGGSFAGSIQGNIAVMRSTDNAAFADWNLYTANTFTGPLLLNGGRTQLLGEATFSNVSAIELSQSTLLLSNNNGTSIADVNINDRINDAAAIYMRGAMFQYRARFGEVGFEKIGDVTLGVGASAIDVAEPGTALNESTLTINSLTREAGSRATLRFFGVDGQIGSLAQIFITNAPVLDNHIIGGWAVVEREFATYSSATGIAALNATGAIGYAQNTLNTGLTTDNIRITAVGASTLTANRDINSLAIVVSGATNLNLGGFTLTLGSGGLIASNATDNSAITISNGDLTSGDLNVASDLYLHSLGYNNTADVTNRDVLVSARIVNNGTGAVTLVLNADSGRGTGNNTNETVLSGANTYTGGTFVNGGRVQLNTAGANGSTITATGTGNLTITGGTSTNGSTFDERSATVMLMSSNQIHNSAIVTINGGATLNLNGFNQTLGGLVFNNTGGNTPTVSTGTNGILTLNGNVTATSQNIGNAAVSAMTTAGTGFISLGGATRTFDVSAVKFNGKNISPLIATLNISGVMRGTGNEGIIKTGDGLLQLGGASTFTGGVDLQQGGIAIATSSTPSTLGALVTSGPLGTGTFKIGANTYLTSTGGHTLANNLNLNNNLTFRGANSLTFNGNATLTTGGTFTVNVEEANFTAIFNGLINANSDFTLVKDGLGTLRLGNNYNQVSAVTLNQGTLELFGTTFGVTSPVGTAAITMNGGLLSLRNNGGGGTPSGAVISYNNDLILGAGLTDAQLNVNNVSAGTNNIIQMGKLTTTTNNQQISLSSANGYNLRFVGADINTQARFAIQSGTTLTVLLSNVGASQTVTGSGTIVAGGDNYVNTGAGTLVVGVGVKTNTTTDMPGGPINFAAGNNTFIPLAGTFSNAGYTKGGLMVRQTSFAAAQNANSVANSGVGPSAAFVGITPPADTGYNNRPPVGVASTLTNSSITYSGLVEITSGGTYAFRIADDDQAALFIDGVMVLADNINGGGQGLTERNTAYIELSAGYHQIVFVGVNAGGGGGFNLLYSGPDTASNGSPNGFQAIDPNKLYYASNLGNAGNGFLNAARISDTYNLAASQASTLDGQGTHFNLTFGALTMGASSSLTVQNQFGTGYYGVEGVTTIGGSGVTVNPTTGTLYLAGGVNDGAALGLTKTGAGSLYLGTSTNFTGAFNMNAGFTLLAATNALSSGSNVVASGAQLDLYGNSSHGNVTLNGSGVTLLASGTTAALWNSLANSTGTLTGNVTIGAGSTRIGGIGDIVLSGALSDGAALGFTKIGGNTLTLSGNNVGFTGVASISNGILKLGSNTALGTGGSSASNTVISSASAGNGAVLDLNGMNIANEFLSVAGIGFNNRGTSPNTLAAIINSSNTMATWGGNITMTAATSIGSNRLNANSGVATAGDITLTGAVTGAFALTKVGNNTLFITGSGNTYNGMAINGGKVVVSGAGQLGTGGNHSIAGYGQPTGLLPATTLQLDNTGTASNSRLGGRALSIRNGHLIIDGHASTAVNENLGANNLTISLGHNVITLNNNGGSLTLSVNQLIRDGSATLVIRGSENDIGSSDTRLLVTSGTANAIIPVGTENTTLQFTDTDTSGILPWILIDNSILNPGFGAYSMSFARYDSSLGLTNLAVYALELPTTGTVNGTGDVNLAVVTDLTLQNTLSVNDINLQTTGVNSITFNDDPVGATITLEDLQILTLDSGGILALSSGNFAGNGSLNVAGNRQFVIHTIGASTVLNADVEMGGRLAPTQGGLAKTGEGTLILGERNNYTGSTVINLGTLKLDGGDNTLYYQFTVAPVSSTPNSTPQGQVLAVAPGGILDLNGTNQSINLLQGNGGQNVAGAGGIITNTSATASTLRLVVNGNVNWQGSINGNTNVIKSGGSTTIFYDNNAFTGNLLVQGGVFSLQDQGRVSGASSITVSRGILRWDDTGMQQTANRFGTAAITLNGGTLDFRGRGGTNTVMDVGSIHLAGGASYISATPNTGTVTVRMDGLTRTNNSTLTFAASSGTPGANPFFYFDSAPTLTNGIIGGWAYALGTDGLTAGTNIEFATYDTASGVRQLSGAQMVNHFNDPLANVRFNGNTTVKAGGAVINSLTLNGGAVTLSFSAANDVLNITSGGLLGGLDSNVRTIGSVATPGILTAGGVNPTSDVYLYVTNPSNNMVINSIIADNPTNGRKLHLVLGSAGRVDNSARITLGNANTYTGLTYVQGARVDLANLTGSGNAITGDLIIAGGVQDLSDTANPDTQRVYNRGNEQIADTANVTLLGNGAWDVGGYTETINNLIFQSEGGSRNNAGPRVLTGPGTLVVNGSVTATNLINASAVPLIAGHINFGSDNALTVTVDKVAGASNGIHNQIGLAMNVNVIGGGTLTKQGDGMLSLGGHSDTAFQVNVATGDLTLNSTASYRNATINLASGTKLDMRGLTNVVVGNVTGTGTIFNFHVGTAGNLVTGGANTDATFDGLFSSEFTSGMINVTKVGTGTWTLTADNTQHLSGTLSLLDGRILLNGTTARLGFAQQNIATGGVLTLDNSTNVLNFRLGGPIAESSTGIRTAALQIGTTNINYTIPNGDPNPNRNMEFRGGTVNLIGGSTNVMEVLNQVAMTSGAGVLNMTASSAETVFITHNLAGVNNGILYLNAVGSGAILGGTKGAGHVNFAATTPNLLGGGGLAGTKNMSIRPDIIGTDSTGTGFVTHDLDGLRLLTAAEYKTPDTRYLGNANPLRVSTVPGAAPGDNVGTADNVRTNLTHSMDNSTSVNSLTLQSGGGVDSTGGGMLLGTAQGQSAAGRMFNGSGTLNTLTISSGGLLAFAGNTGIQGGVITSASDRRLYITTLGDLTIDSYIIGVGGTAANQGIVKSGAGTLTLGKKTLGIGVLSLQEGTLVLNAGDNTIMVAPTGGTATQLDFNLNGGTLDLNGNDQAFGRITTTSGDTAPNGAGDITNTGALASLYTNTQAGNVTYSGNISGATNVVKTGANTWTLTGTHSYTGATIVRGGTLQLRDDGVLANTSNIELNYGTLLVDNTGWYGQNRLRSGVNMTLRGGTFQFTPRQTQVTSTNMENVGTIDFADGMSRFLFNVTQGSSVTLNATSLARSNGDATWFVNPGIGVLGRGSSDNNDQSPQLILQNAPTLTNGLIGGWAIHNGDNWLVYQAGVHSSGGTGVGAMSDTGAGFITYDEDTGTVANFSAADSIATRNMRLQNNTYQVADIGGTGTAGNFLLNSLNFLTNTNGQTLEFVDSLDTLYLTAGAFLRSGNVTANIGNAVNNGRISAGVVGATGVQHLYMYNNQNVLTINSRIVDNSASAPVRLVLWSANSGRIDLASVNLHTGGTVVNGLTNTTTVQLNIANAVPAGGLTINDTNVITNTSANVVNGVNASNVVTINGGGILNLTTNAVATNTLAGLVFNNSGGTTTPQVIIGLNTSTLILSGTNAITATNENYQTLPTIAVTTAGNLQFSAAAPVITVNNPSGIATHGLQINAVIQTNAGWTQALTKDGNGMLSLTVANTFAQGIVLKDGGIVLGNAGSLGTGKLTIGDGAAGGTHTLMTNGVAALTITNQIDINEDLIIGGTNANSGTNHNLTASGAVALGGGDRVITVESPTVTFTIGGVVSSTGGGLIKDGDGILQLNGANTYTGNTRVKRGLLKQGSGTALAGSHLIVESAGTVDMNGNAMTVKSLSGEDSLHGGVITNSANNTQTLTVGDVLASVDTTFAGIITDARAITATTNSRLNLVKNGNSRQKLTGLNTYGGTTTVNSSTTTLGGGGHLQVGENGIGQTGTGVTRVTAGATLSGSGLINGTPNSTAHVVESGGRISPGDNYGASNGILTFNGNLTLNAGSQSVFQLTSRTTSTTIGGGFVNVATSMSGELATWNSAAVPAGAHDALQINGSLTVTGGNPTPLFLVEDNGYLLNASMGDVFDLLDWTGAALASFNAGTNFRSGGSGGGDLFLPTLVSSNQVWDVSAFASHGFLVVVPEPSRAILLLGGLLLLLSVRRRRNW
ncbi:putative secreted protein with PEP-CTERM sorting signal [Roseimicrobium gellanilyticum]|uniref:Putative secreted protein with PEP-CTERM sorting signal n=1 Tax=Roseimicrobium gellanilyticum TaxID=748857 RepID=A0A366HW20_9BACT|nr:autotransporter-associated beta strand repeat-containing protein [Roseimicrobium gellanilyticum]RBP47685.1 putative secreted protein with PEP-CTERM sorting signal [Roseimicrobium gellanilyticum]